MGTTTLNPSSTESGRTNATLTGTTLDGALSDASDATFYQESATGSFSGSDNGAAVGFSGFTLPSGAVVKQFEVTVRGASGNASPYTATYKLHVPESGTTITSHGEAGILSNGVTYPNTTIQNDTLTYDFAFPFSAAQVNGMLFSLGHNGSTPRGKVYKVSIVVRYAEAPTTSAVTTTPSGTITTTRQPSVGWTFTQGTDGAGGQTSFEVKIFTAAIYGGGGFSADTSTAAYHGSSASSSATSHSLSSPLPNGVTYKAYVRTAQTTAGQTQWSAWVAGSAFAIAIAVPVPTSVVPVDGATVTTSRPAVNAAVGAMTTGSLVKREWLFATNTGFSTGLVTVTEPDANLAATQSVSFAFPVTSRIPQGTVYVKCRAIDQDGVAGSYSAYNTITVAHKPSTSGRAPSGGSSQYYSTTPTVNWTFNDIDIDDFQTKFQVQLWKTSAPGTILDSGTVTSGNGFYQFLTGIDATWKDVELRWKVKVYDQDNVASDFSVENVHYLRDQPTVTMVHPTAAEVMTSPSPLIDWTFTASAGRTETQWKVDILQGATLVISSGWVSSAATEWQIPSPVIAIGPTYTCVLDTSDSVGLLNHLSTDFTASYAAPAVTSWFIDSSLYPLQGLYRIDWSNSTPDANFFSWKVLRSIDGADYEVLFETTTVGTREFLDYLAPSKSTVSYVVTQTILTFGVYVDSTYVAQSVALEALKYMIVCPHVPSLNFTFMSANADNFEDEQEMATINLLGRGRRVEYGGKYGQTGTLAASIKDIVGGFSARAQRLQIEALRDSGEVIFLRNPFGDVFQVALQNAKFDRVAGVGTLEYLQLTIDYLEITA